MNATKTKTSKYERAEEITIVLSREEATALRSQTMGCSAYLRLFNEALDTALKDVKQ